MAQTKRKRRTKHRGNAAGAIEVRGDTAKPRSGGRHEGPGGGVIVDKRTGRELRPPTLQSSMIKALFGAALLFLMFQFIGNTRSITQSALMAGVALLFYTPIMYMTDKWVYKRKLKALGR